MSGEIPSKPEGGEQKESTEQLFSEWMRLRDEEWKAAMAKIEFESHLSSEKMDILRGKLAEKVEKNKQNLRKVTP